MSLAERVKNRRIELGLTQAQAAELAKISQQSWGSIEDGKTKKPRNIIGIAKALQSDPLWLLEGGTFKTMADVGTRKIPLISYVQAGALVLNSQITSELGDFEYVLTDMDWSENAFALKIQGDSMQPEFKEGDVVIIDPEIQPHPGEFVVAKNGEHEATFKKYRPLAQTFAAKEAFELVPLNPDYPTIPAVQGEVKIIGTMVEHRIYRRKR
jgi:SOS-response transcriptional repressor LexA